MDHIGKTIYRNKTTCDCGVCESGYANGIYVMDDLHADYLFLNEVSHNSTNHRIPIKYFSTKLEAENYAKSLNNIKMKNQLAQDIHQEQKDKGWYDNHRSDALLIMLVQSELFEAFEAWRKDNNAIYPDDFYSDEIDDDYFEKAVSLFRAGKEEEIDSKVYANIFKVYIKDTYQDEIADVVIRLLDFAAYKDIKLDKSDFDIDFDVNSHFQFMYSINRQLFFLNEEENRIGMAHTISGLIRAAERHIEALGFDLYFHVDIKRIYNRTRPTRHGNKKA